MPLELLRKMVTIIAMFGLVKAFALVSGWNDDTRSIYWVVTLELKVVVVQLLNHHPFKRCKGGGVQRLQKTQPMGVQPPNERFNPHGFNSERKVQPTRVEAFEGGGVQPFVRS